MVQDRKAPIRRLSAINVLVALASGAAGALLFFLASRGTWAGMLLSYFAPLPPMIATLGFGFATGGAAVLAGALLAGILASPIVGLAVGAGLFLPAYLLCVTALRSPGVPPDDRRVPRVVLASIVFAIMSALAVVLSLVLAHGGAVSARNAITAAVLPMLRSVVQESRLPANVTGEDLARILVALAPAIIAASSFFMLTANVYLAGRVAQISGQLANPWPSIADTLALPGVAAGLFALACGLVFFGGLPGMIAAIVASALGCGFSLQGLAVIHAMTRSMAARTAVLIALYLLVLCVPPWPLLVLALLGFVDAAFHLRRRAAKVSDKP